MQKKKNVFFHKGRHEVKGKDYETGITNAGLKTIQSGAKRQFDSQIPINQFIRRRNIVQFKNCILMPQQDKIFLKDLYS